MMRQVVHAFVCVERTPHVVGPKHIAVSVVHRRQLFHPECYPNRTATAAGSCVISKM